MMYNKESLSSFENDQIIIKQKQNNKHQRVIVYKGYVKKDGSFDYIYIFIYV